MKNLLASILLLIPAFGYGQGIAEKSLDKYNVQTIEVLGHSFNVGDTLTFTNGSSPNGDFISTQLSPSAFLSAGETPPHLTATYNNFRYIIEKIRYIKQGLNSQTLLIIYIGKKTPVYVDVQVAIVKNEIFLK